ncbi:IS3 family transposase [Eremococcus coleocola]|uniref:IS3 family transposase n=1 Tax=Eremococcus coleocola TaxID=88132 RepID=UPI0009DBFDB0|nr:IS3 family transposase [Eremococcus coleocola]
MSRKGNCHDNTPMENFFSVMKQEMYYDKIYHSYRELETAIIEYIQYYHAERIK